MRYYSTKNPNKFYSSRDAVLKSMPDDGGLFMPETIPAFEKKYFRKVLSSGIHETATDIAELFFSDAVPREKLSQIVSETLNFPLPLVKITDNIFSLELHHGPTLAFKDIGARFLARIISYLVKSENRKTTILVATSGDTGGAVADGFFGVENIDVVILYPAGRISELQEKQIASRGKNISALKVAGSFDDCQRLVKQAFADEELNKSVQLTSANSINIARLIPQVFYYFSAWKSLGDENASPVFSVPCGNFGNLSAGLIAWKMGLPVQHFVASTNINNTVPEYFNTEIFQPKTSQATISNAMDVGDPSNFVRMLEIFKHDLNEIRENISGYFFTDDKTRQAIHELYSIHKYLSDPHTAVGYAGLKKYFSENKTSTGIFISTAHPAKFPESVQAVTGNTVEIPERLAVLKNYPVQSISIRNDYTELKEFLMEKK
ncbi:MAG: threonine synthase [Bacteroidia bacterium]|nr:threonine synthase [Bacteroidia bacterium]